MDQQVHVESPPSQQQSRVSSFFRNVHSKFSPGSKVDDVVITSTVLRKKPQLVIGTNASNLVTLPADSNGESLAGSKRKATTEMEGAINKRTMHEVSIPSYSNLQPATSIKQGVKEPTRLVKRVTWEQDSDWIAMNEPVSIASEENNDVECVVRKQSVVQPPPSCNSQQKGTRLGTEGEKIIDDKKGSFGSENGTASGNCHKKDDPSGSKWRLPVDLKGDVFSCKLKEILSKPFDEAEWNEMWNLATRRKPVLKLRQTRGRTMQVCTKDEGLSYLDHHPDLAQQLEESSPPSHKLALLRSFLFWLQHSCMEGAYKPWALASKSTTEENDCDFTDGPDCEVLAVVLPLDEKKDVSTVVKPVEPVTVVKPVEPVTVDLSDDDDDDCVEVSAKSPVKAEPKPSTCSNFLKAASCNICCKPFGTELEQQRALYKSCGHIETCMKCVDRLWMVGKHNCLTCGTLQVVRPRSIMDFADDSD